MKPHHQPDPEGLARRVDKMLASGRVTAGEADAIRSATTPEGAEAAIDAIRQRHMSAHVEEAVAAGSVSEADGQELVERARSEGPEVLRGLRHKGKGTSGS